VLHTESSLNWGGEEHRICQEAQWLLKRGHRCVIACPPQSEIYRCAAEMGIPVAAAPMRNSADWRGFLAIRRVMHESKIQIINTHGSKDTWLALPFFLQGTPVVRTRHITDAVRRGYRHSFGYRYACDRVVASANCIKNALVMENGLPESHVQVVGEFVDLHRFRPAAFVRENYFRTKFNVPDSHLLFTVVGMIRSEKGQANFVDAAMRLLKTNTKIRFAIVGEGVGDHAYELRCKEKLQRAFGLHCDLRHTPIFMTGFIPDVREAMAASDLIVVPSHAEAQSKVIPEAFAMGACVLATEVGGIPEVVQHGKTGWLVPPRDSNALAEAMRVLAENEGLRRHLASGVRAYAEQHFSIDGRMNQTVELYRTLLETRSSSKGRMPRS
jgi:glycosyltransferase involved in cell wall biosynthesis